ncbi:MAG: T9SS type A sorting domain-containing protein [Bacteroidales bacterium]|nr:T9SS type A sorting domain-containing protein [Bacteroidales bacterium]
MKNLFLLIASIAFAITSFSQNYPFPMNESGYSYPYGIVPSTVSNSTIQSKFKAWENAMWEESGNYGRIKFDPDNVDKTVSEGIGYGMLIYVYMANETNTQCQDHFDKLYNYYKRWSNSKGLMNWKIVGFNSIASDGSGAATDADLDVALALCLAAKQWGSSSNYNYAQEAETLLSKIYQYETSTHNGLRVFKPGDSWDNNGNPCYFTQASVGVFKQAQEALGFSTTKDWATIYDDGFTYLEKSERNGVWPNWTDWSSNFAPAKRPWGDNSDYDFGWDACRVPWRIGWDYVWFGSSSSKAMLEKTVAMMSAKNALTSPSKVGYFSNLTGSSYSALEISDKPYERGNVAWTGSLACAFMIDDDYQSYLDTYYNDLKSKTGSAYYAQTVQVLYLLTLSGNAANFYDCDGGSVVITNPVISAAETDGSKITLTCSKKMVSSNNYSGFTIYKGGVAQSNAISSMSVSGKTITLTLNNNISIESGDMLAISYNGTYLQSEEGGTLGDVVKMTVKNNVPGGSTILADCETDKCLLGGPWYNYDDKNSNAASTISPSNASDMIVSGGKNGSAIKVTYRLDKGSYQYDPFVGFGFNLYEGTDENKGVYETLDCTGATGISFYHKGTAVTFLVKTPGTGGNYHGYTIDAHNDWTPVTITWDKLEQEPYWGTEIEFSEKNIYGLQWQVKGTTGTNGDIWIDDVTLLGKSIDISLNHSDLEATLATANALYNEATTDKYPQSAITTFYNAIDAAATTNMTAKTQSELDDANTTLTQAIATFKSTMFDNSKLLATIATAEALYNSATTDKYPQSAINDFATAIATARTASSQTTQTALDNANTALTNAIATFKASEIKPVVNKEDLSTLISNTKSILNTTTAGTAVGQYSATLRTKLQTALSNAETINNKATATQTEVDNQVSALRTAYNAYMASEVKTAVDDLEFAFSVYPNPCVDVLNIEANNEIAFVKILGLNGSKSTIEVNQTTAQISVTSLTNGIYVMQVVFTDGSVKTTQFVKK